MKYMVANPDMKSGFQTDSKPDLTKNWDPVFIRISFFKLGSKPDLNLKSVFKPDFKSEIRIKTRFRISNPDFISGLKPEFRV
jgi:hypothetical protein